MKEGDSRLRVNDVKEGDSRLRVNEGTAMECVVGATLAVVRKGAVSPFILSNFGADVSPARTDGALLIAGNAQCISVAIRDGTQPLQPVN